MPKTDDLQVRNMSEEEMAKAHAFHQSFPQYSVTPLTRLSNLAEYLGLKRLYVKDESYRFGLNAFKVLGGSYAIARYIAQQLGKDVSEVPYNVLTLPRPTAITEEALPGLPTSWARNAW